MLLFCYNVDKIESGKNIVSHGKVREKLKKMATLFNLISFITTRMFRIASLMDCRRWILSMTWASRTRASKMSSRYAEYFNKCRASYEPYVSYERAISQRSIWGLFTNWPRILWMGFVIEMSWPEKKYIAGNNDTVKQTMLYFKHVDIFRN